ncbi:membrane-bound PQQ-dependent dehydrogenase, glucose/quinate/shikimate family [Neisseriaceae bacterium ESL0693]|nr:membrane-bound PQQ-dependent dehydrogenase, glucose/quinate/shikimate family [Neisseriaceae bacterium ESL0693]
MNQRAGFLPKLLFLIVVWLFIVFLLLGGGYLLFLGGSPYYVLAALALMVFACLFRRNRGGSLWWFAAILLVSLLWSLWEVNTDFWALAPRLDIWFLLGLWLVLPWGTRQLQQRQGKKAIALMLVVILVTLAYSWLHDPQEINGTISRTQPAPVPDPNGIKAEDWPAYGRTQGGSRYSPLAQINERNVHQLKVAWVYHTGDFKTANDSAETTNEVTPIKVGKQVFLCTPHQYLDALDAATGKRLWRYDPKIKSNRTFQHLTCRGVSYHDAAWAAEVAPQKASLCPRKVILPVDDGRLIAINADNGQPCQDFGQQGEINLQYKMPNAYAGGYNPTSPPVVTPTAIIIGGSVTDNYSTKEPSGVIRAYDATSGALKWIFDTGAANPNAMPGENTTFVHNSPNAWAPLAYDRQRNIVYVPTGVGTPDIWGGDRTPLKERYANSVLALNADNGHLIWHFQTTHHDLWDMDVPSQPSLMDLTLPTGQKVPAIYVLTKTGNVFVLNRETGEPIVPVTSKAVPQTVQRGPQTEGEHYAPRQPFSALNVLTPKRKLSDKDMWGGTMLDQLVCRIMFKRLNYEGIYTPPSVNGTLVYPGDLGVFEWGGMSVNQDRQIGLMNPIGLPFVSRLIPRDIKVGEHGPVDKKNIQPMHGTPYGVVIGPFLSPLGLPCKQPSWGFVTGVDLTTHQVVWKKRIGTIRDSLPKLFQLPPIRIGIPGLGGPMSTAGNLMFVAATQDDYLRAYSTTNGQLLWQARLPAGGQATPMTYAVDGKQYVLIMAGGHASFGTKMGDTLVAYALP